MRSNRGANITAVRRGALLTLAMCTIALAVHTARAVDPVPDYKTLIMPTLVPKAGHGAVPPADAQPGDIRNAYDVTYENYWKETSYFSYSPTNGAKIRGYYNDTKTYGYIQLPWPIRPRGGFSMGTGAGDRFVTWENLEVNQTVDDIQDGKRMFSENVSYVPDDADFDGVWTPGESFNDVNGNGQWDPAVPAVPGTNAESFWNASLPAATNWGLQSTLGDAWDSNRGEFFADYNYNCNPAGGVVGFDSDVLIWVADIGGGTNIPVHINELDLIGLNPQTSQYTIQGNGDGVHTFAANGNPAQADIPLNRMFDFSEATNDMPQVHAALNQAGTLVTISYQSWRYRNVQAAPPDPYHLVYTNAVSVQSFDPTFTNVFPEPITVQVYQTGELFVGPRRAGAGWRSYGDNGNPGFTSIADNLATPAIPEVPAVPAEPFEDFISWNGSWVTNIVDPGSGQINPRDRDPVKAITRQEYDRYVLWNYAGAATALVARAGNGVYDGPEEWTEVANNKVKQNELITGVQVDGAPIVALEPDPAVADHWDGREYATWKDWWSAAFGEQTVEYNGHFYQVVTTQVTWSAANLLAQARGGYLVHINDAAENEFVSGLVDALHGWSSVPMGTVPWQYVWIGATDRSVEGTWRWTDNSLLSSGFQQWWAAQPDDAAPGEDFAAMAGGNTLFYFNDVQVYPWFDLASSVMLSYVVEYDREPATLLEATAPAWPNEVPNYAAYTPSPLPAGGGWIPADSWGYDSPREFCDLPSSMYHIGGSPLGALSFVEMYDEDNQLNNTVGIRGGDMALGEVTSPWNDLNWGQDLWAESATGANPSGPDGTIPSCGPFAYNIHGLHGFDAGNMLTLEWLTWNTTGVSGRDLHPKAFRDTNLDGALDLGVSRTGDAHYSTDKTGRPGGDGAGPYPFNRERFMEECMEVWDHSEDFGAFRNHITGARTPLYGYPIYPPSEGNPGWAALGGPAGANVTVLTRDDSTGFKVTFQVRPINASGEGNAAVQNAGFGMGLLCHEQGHDIQGWPDLYDYDVWNALGEDIINSPIAGYDLMAGGMVHGLPDLKNSAGWLLKFPDLTQVVPLSTGISQRVTVKMYPVEDFADQYYRLYNPTRSGEYLDFWYTAMSTPYGAAGGPGVYVAHMDKYGDPNSMPRQQRVNNHFVWEVVQADGRSDLEDGVNGGDAGDPFPGTSGKLVYSADTDPAARWWDQSDIGLRIVDIQIPTAAGQPALVTFERYDVTNEWLWPEAGADTDGDGIPDVWEYHYFGNLTTADAASDSDFDGLSDLGEYLSQTDPMNATTSTDASDDSDGDGINNLDEVTTYGTDPSLADTDDDGVPDGVEVSLNSNPTNSLSPYFGRILELNGSSGSYVEMPELAQDKRFALGQWTIEAWIKPRSSPATEATIISRQFDGDKRYNFNLSLANNQTLVARFSPSDGSTNVELRTLASMPITNGVWSHVCASYVASNGLFRIQVDGALRATRSIKRNPTQLGVGTPHTVIGQGFDGWLDEVHIWSVYPGSRQLLTLRDPLTGSESNVVCNLRFDDDTNPNGTSSLLGLSRGQVEDFTIPRNWIGRWLNAGTLMGSAHVVPNEADGPGAPPEPDSDGDGLPDWWEERYFPGEDALPFLDPDGDGLVNILEYQLGTNPWNPDNPADTGTDSDGDGLNNALELQIGTDPYSADTDGDGMPDGWEYGHNLQPTVDDTWEDMDGDGMNNISEYTADTDPNNPASVLAITGLKVSASGITVGWKGGVSAIQSLEATTGGTGMVWISILTNLPPTSPTGQYLDASATNSSLLYRVKAYRIKAFRP